MMQVKNDAQFLTYLLILVEFLSIYLGKFEFTREFILLLLLVVEFNLALASYTSVWHKVDNL